MITKYYDGTVHISNTRNHTNVELNAEEYESLRRQIINPPKCVVIKDPPKLSWPCHHGQECSDGRCRKCKEDI